MRPVCPELKHFLCKASKTRAASSLASSSSLSSSLLKYDRKVRGLEDKDGPVWEEGWGSIAECVQEGGDVIYIPDGWNHAVLNTQESVGIAIELGDNAQLWEAVRGLAQ